MREFFGIIGGMFFGIWIFSALTNTLNLYITERFLFILGGVAWTTFVIIGFVVFLIGGAWLGFRALEKR